MRCVFYFVAKKLEDGSWFDKLIHVLSVILNGRTGGHIDYEKKDGKMAKQELMNEYTKTHLLGYAQLLADVGREYLGGDISEGHALGNPQAREGLFMQRQMDVSFVQFSRFLLEAAEHIEQIAKEDAQQAVVDKKIEKKLWKEMYRAGIEVHHFYQKRNRNGHAEIGMVVSALGRDFYNVADIADLLSRLYHRTMLPLTDGYQYVHRDQIPVVFEEDTPLQIDSGYAVATKDGELVSGDNYLLRDFGDGTFVAAIADGMGSGEQACKNSERALALLERYLEAGLSISQLVQSYNRILYLRRDQEQSVTMDVFECDQYTGMAKLYKYGAAGSYLLRGKRIRSIGPSGTALGIHADVRGAVETLYLKPDDILILLSDGIMDYYSEKMEEFEQLLSSVRVSTLAELATQILHHVIIAQGGTLLDDMTALVVQIYEKDA